MDVDARCLPDGLRDVPMIFVEAGEAYALAGDGLGAWAGKVGS